MKIKAFFSENKKVIIGSIIGMVLGSISVAGIFTFVGKQVSLPWSNKKDIEKIYIKLNDLEAKKLDKSDFILYQKSEDGKWKSINSKVEIILVYTKP